MTDAHSLFMSYEEESLIFFPKYKVKCIAICYYLMQNVLPHIHEMNCISLMWNISVSVSEPSETSSVIMINRLMQPIIHCKYPHFDGC